MGSVGSGGGTWEERGEEILETIYMYLKLMPSNSWEGPSTV